MSKKEKTGEPKDEIKKETEAVESAEEKIFALEAEIAKKDDELKKLCESSKEQEEKYLRLAAEYDNFRKRSQKEREACYTEAFANAVAGFLPLIDNMERAMEFASDDSKLAEGVRMMKKQLDDMLTKIGVSEIVSDGESFDPEKHNAIMHESDDSGSESTVVQTLQKGYMLKDKIIRYAMVKVLN